MKPGSRDFRVKVRKQIQLSENQQETLKAVSLQTGKSENQLIQEALDRYLEGCEEAKRLDKLLAAAGIWRDRNDFPNVREMREEWETRTTRTKRGAKKS